MERVWKQFRYIWDENWECRIRLGSLVVSLIKDPFIFQEKVETFKNFSSLLDFYLHDFFFILSQNKRETNIENQKNAGKAFHLLSSKREDDVPLSETGVFSYGLS